MGFVKFKNLARGRGEREKAQGKTLGWDRKQNKRSIFLFSGCRPRRVTSFFRSFLWRAKPFIYLANREKAGRKNSKQPESSLFLILSLQSKDKQTDYQHTMKQSARKSSQERIIERLERLRFTFTPNGKREFVPRDEVFPLIVVYCFLLVHRNKWFHASFIHKNRSGLFLSSYFLF